MAIKSSFFFRTADFLSFVIHGFINCLLFLLDRGQNETINSQSNNGGADNKVSSTTVPKSDGSAEETGKDNSGREDGVLESVGLKHIYQLLVSPNWWTNANPAFLLATLLEGYY